MEDYVEPSYITRHGRQFMMHHDCKCIDHDIYYMTVVDWIWKYANKIKLCYECGEVEITNAGVTAHYYYGKISPLEFDPTAKNKTLGYNMWPIPNAVKRYIKGYMEYEKFDLKSDISKMKNPDMSIMNAQGEVFVMDLDFGEEDEDSNDLPPKPFGWISFVAARDIFVKTGHLEKYNEYVDAEITLLVENE